MEKIQVYRRNYVQRIKRIPRKKIKKIIKTKNQKAEGTREDNYRHLWMCDTGTEEAQIHES